MGNQLFSREAEQSVIGGMFVSPVRFSDVSEAVAVDDFADEGHRLIFGAMAGLAKAGKGLDIVTVGDQLEQTGSLERAGGFAYLAMMCRDTPSAANVISYAEIVRGYSQRRKLMQLGLKLQQWATSDSDANLTLERLQQAIAKLDDATQQTGPVLIKDRLVEVIDVIDQRYNGLSGRGVSTGIATLDDMIMGLRPGRAHVVAGRPGMGKSVMGLQLCAAVAGSQQDNRPALLFTLEMTTDEQIERLISSTGSIDIASVQSGQLTEDDWPRLTGAVSRLNDSPIWIDDTPGLKLDALLSRARRLHRKTPLGAVVVDHVGLIAHKGESRQISQQEVALALKNLAKELNCPVIELVQLNRSVERRGDKRPLMSDLRETGEYEQSADVVMMLYRDEYYSENSIDKGCAELLIRKNRGGKTGMIPLAFLGDRSRFETLHGELPSKLNPPRPASRGIDL